MTPDAERYFRDLYDHLIRISDLVDSYRDLTSGALDTHLSTVSNRLNVVMKQLTIIATIFLPMSFLTGFFGQNFAWMVNRITTLPVFLVVGVGLQLLTAGALSSCSAAAAGCHRTARSHPPPRPTDPAWHATNAGPCSTRRKGRKRSSRPSAAPSRGPPGRPAGHRSRRPGRTQQSA